MPAFWSSVPVAPGSVQPSPAPSNPPGQRSPSPGQKTRLKLSAFTFQKYGLVEGEVLHVGADSAEQGGDASGAARSRAGVPLAYKTLVALKSQTLDFGGEKYRLQPGMQVAAEIHLGTRTVMEYLLSPVQKAWHEAARER